MEMKKSPASVLPFTQADLVGPQDRPRPEWEITMYKWQGRGNPTIKEYLDSMTGAPVVAIHAAPMPADGVIYVTSCAATALKAHHVSFGQDHRSVSFSLYTPLLAFSFPRVDDDHKVIFKCRPETYGDDRVLVIAVTGYRVEKVDKESQQASGEAAQA